MRRFGRAGQIAFVAGCLLHLSLPVLPRHAFGLGRGASVERRGPARRRGRCARRRPGRRRSRRCSRAPSPASPTRSRACDGADSAVVGFLLGLGLTQLCFGHGIPGPSSRCTGRSSRRSPASRSERAGSSSSPSRRCCSAVDPCSARAASNALYRTSTVRGPRTSPPPTLPTSASRWSTAGRAGARSISTAEILTPPILRSNEYLAIVPARLARPSSTLVIGNGTLSLVAPLGRSLSDSAHRGDRPGRHRGRSSALQPERRPRQCRLAARRRRRQAVPRARRGRSIRSSSTCRARSRSRRPSSTHASSTRSFAHASRAARRRLRPAERTSPRRPRAIAVARHRRARRAPRGPRRGERRRRPRLRLCIVEAPVNADDVRAFAPPSRRGSLCPHPETVRATAGAHPLDIDSLDSVPRRGFERVIVAARERGPTSERRAKVAASVTGFHFAALQVGAFLQSKASSSAWSTYAALTSAWLAGTLFGSGSRSWPARRSSQASAFEGRVCFQTAGAVVALDVRLRDRRGRRRKGSGQADSSLAPARRRATEGVVLYENNGFLGSGGGSVRLRLWRTCGARGAPARHDGGAIRAGRDLEVPAVWRLEP